MKENIIAIKTYQFAIQIVNLSKDLSAKKEYVLSRQILKSGTSIGANLSEAKAAISTKDLSAKVSIAYKEAQESKYWLDLLHDTEYLSKEAHASLHQDADQICAILFSTLKTTRIGKQ